MSGQAKNECCRSSEARTKFECLVADVNKAYADAGEEMPSVLAMGSLCPAEANPASFCESCNGTDQVELTDLGDGALLTTDQAQSRREADERIMAEYRKGGGR